MVGHPHHLTALLRRDGRQLLTLDTPSPKVLKKKEKSINLLLYSLYNDVVPTKEETSKIPSNLWKLIDFWLNIGITLFMVSYSYQEDRNFLFA